MVMRSAEERRDRVLTHDVTANTIRSFLPGTRLARRALARTMFPCWSDNRTFKMARRSHECPAYANTPDGQVCCTTGDNAISSVQTYLIQLTKIARHASVPSIRLADVFDGLLKWAQWNSWPLHPGYGDPNIVTIRADDPNLDILRQFLLACEPLPYGLAPLTIAVVLEQSQENALFIPRMQGGSFSYTLPVSANPADFIDMSVIIDTLRNGSCTTTFSLPGTRFAVPATPQPVSPLSNFLYEALTIFRGRIQERGDFEFNLLLPDEDPGIAPAGLTFIGPRQDVEDFIDLIGAELLTLDSDHHRIIESEVTDLDGNSFVNFQIAQGDYVGVMTVYNWDDGGLGILFIRSLRP